MADNPQTRQAAPDSGGPPAHRAVQALRAAAERAKDGLARRFPNVDRPELEQAGLRVLIVGLVLAFSVYLAHTGEAGTVQQVALVALATFVFSLALLARVLHAGGTSVVRRVVGMIADNTVTSYFLLQMQETGAIIIGVYLFVTFGNGFRYGRRYLHLCQAMALAGFGLVIAMSEYWRSHPSLSIGLLLALIVLPFYVAVLAERITEAMHRADEANKAKGLFLANMSHEMRTPLNGVIAMADVLRETRLNQSQVEIVETMTTSAQLLLAQIEDVLDMAKIEAGRIAVEKRPFDLGQLMSTTVKVLLPQARYKGLDLGLDIRPEAARWFDGDAHHLRQVVMNLLANAIKFTERGSVRVVVTVCGRQTGTWVRIEVHDTGVGIPADKQALIFEPFAQADSTITRVYGGTGLGTTIARNLVSLMGGNIGLASEVGVGSCFWLEIPLTPVEEQSPVEQEMIAPGIRIREAAQVSRTAATDARRARSARILVAEDNATNQRVVQLILESAGHSVHLVGNGEQALDALDRESYDLALFDLSMPVVSGLDALRMYRFTASDPIPVLILSANVTREVMEECQAAGAAEFMPKPFRASSLLEAIARHVPDLPEAQAPVLARHGHGEKPRLSVVESVDFDESTFAELCQLSTDPTFVDRLLLGFASDADRLVAEITAAIDTGRFEAVRDGAHALKGGAASVGARALADLAVRLEKAGHDALKSRARQWIGELHAANQRVHASIEQALARGGRGQATPH